MSERRKHQGEKRSMQNSSGIKEHEKGLPELRSCSTFCPFGNHHPIVICSHVSKTAGRWQVDHGGMLSWQGSSAWITAAICFCILTSYFCEMRRVIHVHSDPDHRSGFLRIRSDFHDAGARASPRTSVHS